MINHIFISAYFDFFYFLQKLKYAKTLYATYALSTQTFDELKLPFHHGEGLTSVISKFCFSRSTKGSMVELILR